MKLLNKLLPLLPFLIVFIFSLYTPSDPDLGWHLKYGEYFFQHGTILRENTFSTLMPGYQWANTGWLTDVLTYAAFYLGGFLGLSILGALVVTGTFYFFSKVAKLTLWDQAFLFPFILYLQQPINAVSFRGQQISLLLVGVLFYLLSLYNEKPKTILFTIPLFFLWANLHGEFVLGLALFGLWIILHFVQKIYLHYALQRAKAKKSRWVFTIRTDAYLLGVFLASACVTLINPFGIGIHTAAISHIGSPLLQNIAEYLPFAMLSQPWWSLVIVGILLGICFVALFLRGKVVENLPIFGSGLLLFVLAFEVRRYAWPAYYLILPMLTPLAQYLRPDKKKVTAQLTIIFLGILLLIAVWSKIPLTQFTQYNWNTYCTSPYIKCSPASADYLIKNKLTKDLYSLYGWGGWLIWQYPEIKPTIDGRMHLWSQNGYSGFQEYYAIEQNFKDINKTKYNVAFIPQDKPVYERLLRLENEGKWKMVYEDQYSAIFVRKK